MIIRLFLRLFFAALIVLIIADVFYELHLGWVATLILKLGDDILLLSFALLLISGLIFFGKQISDAIKGYFSMQQRVQRQLFFTLAQHDYLQRLFTAKKKQLLYFANLKTAHLLTKNNNKHCRLLAKSLFKELNKVKNKLSETQFHHYHQAIKQAAAQQQIQCLLALQHEISTLDTH